MKTETCKNCTKYQPAKKPFFNHHGKTGTCEELAYPFNKVSEDGRCQNHEEPSSVVPSA